MRVFILLLLLAGCASNQPAKTSLQTEGTSSFKSGENANLGVNAGMGGVKSFWFMGWPF